MTGYRAASSPPVSPVSPVIVKHLSKKINGEKTIEKNFFCYQSGRLPCCLVTTHTRQVVVSRGGALGALAALTAAQVASPPCFSLSLARAHTYTHTLSLYHTLARG